MFEDLGNLQGITTFKLLNLALLYVKMPVSLQSKPIKFLMKDCLNISNNMLHNLLLSNISKPSIFFSTFE